MQKATTYATENILMFERGDRTLSTRLDCSYALTTQELQQTVVERLQDSQSCDRLKKVHTAGLLAAIHAT